LEGYEKLLQQDIKNPILYFNAGNAYAKNERAGIAIVMFERALRLKPRFPEARKNLAMVGGRQPTTPFFLLIPFALLHRTFSVGELFVLFDAGFFLLLLGMACRLLWKSKPAGRTGLFAAALGLAVFLFFGAYFAVKYYEEALVKSAVIIEEKTLARSGPGEQFLEIHELPEGTTVRELEAPRGEWIKIGFGKKGVGYISRKALMRI